MARRLFCELSPLTWKISYKKSVLLRHLRDLFRRVPFAEKYSDPPLPVLLYSHRSLIRRRLGNVDMTLQENKAVNLSLAAPKVNGILIRPGEVFSFWHLVGDVTAKKGYLPGLTLSNGRTSSGIGGGMCQFTNLLHWMILHSPLTIIEHHHHDGYDLFPDFGRQIPFGTGTSILYNYLDYRFRNDTDQTFQLLVHTDGTHLCGELRAERSLVNSYHVYAENEHFQQEDDGVYRCGEVYRAVYDKRTGRCLKKDLIRKNHAKVLYDTSGLTIRNKE